MRMIITAKTLERYVAEYERWDIHRSFVRNTRLKETTRKM